MAKIDNYEIPDINQLNVTLVKKGLVISYNPDFVLVDKTTEEINDYIQLHGLKQTSIQLIADANLAIKQYRALIEKGLKEMANAYVNQTSSTSQDDLKFDDFSKWVEEAFDTIAVPTDISNMSNDDSELAATDKELIYKYICELYGVIDKHFDDIGKRDSIEELFKDYLNEKMSATLDNIDDKMYEVADRINTFKTNMSTMISNMAAYASESNANNSQNGTT
jgi:hypothetical protein